MSDEAGNGSLGLELYQRQNAPHQPGLHGQEVRVVNLGDVIQVLAIGAVIVAGFLGNIVMCVTLLRTSKLRTVTNIFTATLGITDLGIICFVLPMWMAAIFIDHKHVKTSGDNNVHAHSHHLELCQITGFVTVALMLVSIATISLISLDRYFCICHPLKYPCHVTSKKVFILLFYICIQSLIIASSPLYGWGQYSFKPQNIPICAPDWRIDISYAGFTLTIGLIIPFAIMAFSYICIFQAARKQARRIQQFTLQLIDPWANQRPDSNCMDGSRSTLCTENSGSSRPNTLVRRIRRYKPPITQAGRVYTSISKNLKTLKTVFIVVGVFVICFAPYLIVTICSLNSTIEYNNEERHAPPLGLPTLPLDSQAPPQGKSSIHISPTVEFIVTLMVFSICAINPLVFIFLTRDFRCAALSLVTKCLVFMRCKRLTARVGPADEVSRMKLTVMGNEPSVQVIHLKQSNQNISGNRVVVQTDDCSKQLHMRNSGPFLKNSEGIDSSKSNTRYEEINHKSTDANNQPMVIDVTSNTRVEEHQANGKPIILNVNTRLNNVYHTTTTTQIQVHREIVPSVSTYTQVHCQSCSSLENRNKPEHNIHDDATSCDITKFHPENIQIKDDQSINLNTQFNCEKCEKKQSNDYHYKVVTNRHISQQQPANSQIEDVDKRLDFNNVNTEENTLNNVTNKQQDNAEPVNHTRENVKDVKFGGKKDSKCHVNTNINQSLCLYAPSQHVNTAEDYIDNAKRTADSFSDVLEKKHIFNTKDNVNIIDTNNKNINDKIVNNGKCENGKTNGLLSIKPFLPDISVKHINGEYSSSNGIITGYDRKNNSDMLISKRNAVCREAVGSDCAHFIISELSSGDEIKPSTGTARDVYYYENSSFEQSEL